MRPPSADHSGRDGDRSARAGRRTAWTDGFHELGQVARALNERELDRLGSRRRAPHRGPTEAARR